MLRFLKWTMAALFLCLVVIVIWPRASYKPFQVSVAYKAEAEAYYLTNIKPLPAGWAWDSFETQDGATLRWGMVEPEAPKATIVFAPGYATTQEFHGEQYKALLERNYRVVGIDLRGQGGSSRALPKDPERMWAKSFKVYSDDLAAFVKSLPYDEPLLMVGESFGGHVTLRAVGDHGLKPIGVALIAPMFQINTGEFPYGVMEKIVTAANLLGKSRHYVIGQSRWEPYADDFTKGNACGTYPQRLHAKDVLYTVQPELRIGGFTNKLAAGAIKSGHLIKDPKYLAKIDVPVFMMTAAEDFIVESSVAEKACTEGIQDCKLLTMPDTRHCLTFERDEVLNRIYTEIDSLYQASVK